MARINRTAAALTGLCGLIWAFPGLAQTALDNEPPPRVIEDILRVELNVFSVSFSTQARVDGAVDEPGTLFDGEKDMGLEDSKLLPRAELTLLPGQRHLIRLSSLRAHRTGTSVLTRDIDYEGDIYEVGDLVKSSLNLDLIDLTYGYQFLRRPRGDLAATVGVLIGDFKTNSEVVGQTLREPTGAVVPLPVVGLEGTVNISSRWSLEGRAQYTSLKTDLVDGSLTLLRFAAKWQMNPHVALGLGYRTFDLSAESFDEESTGLVDMQFKGLELFMRASL